MNITPAIRDAVRLQRAIPDLREYSEAVLIWMEKNGVRVLVLHTKFGEVELRRAEEK